MTFKSQKFCKIFKYVYVISVICIGFLIAILQQISDVVDDWLDSQQSIILRFLIEDNVIYILLVLFLITFLKSIGVKDVLGLRTISVVILSYRIAPNSAILTLLVCILIIGILSSISKLNEYKVIGHELQVVQGAPVEYIFKYSRKLLLFCIKNEEKLKWFDPKWTLEISEKSRNDQTMDVMTNIEAVFVGSEQNDDNNNDIEKNRTNMNENENENDNDNHDYISKTQYILLKTVYFLIAVIWTSIIEWVQPITELFLFAHNWQLSVRNVIIIILSEFADFDKAVEAWLLIQGLYNGGDIINAKISAVASKVVFWALGYCLVMPSTLIWAYVYHKKYVKQPDKVDNIRPNGSVSTTPSTSSYT